MSTYAEVMQIREEIHWIVKFTMASLPLEGDCAEVGVYQGGSAAIICKVKGDKPLHLFDTFNGLPPQGIHDVNVADPNTYKASEKSVRELLTEYPNVFFHKGTFPNFDGCSVEDTKFCFVHIDVDLYQSTIDCLEFFYPRMAVGGFILGHDYPVTKGVAKAFNEYMSDKIEPIVRISERQALIHKL
jgi:O-methyltransferase